MLDGLIIRPVKLEDIDDIQIVARLTWNGTYGTIYTEAYINSFLAHAYSKKNLEAAVLRDETRKIRKFMVAQSEAQIVGYAQLTEGKDGEAELTRIYVLPGFQGQGIGKALLKELINPDTALTKVFAWVGKQNQIGTEFYKANDFTFVEENEEVVDGQIIRLCKYIKQLL
jgi:ribosomal protein S18 acetylase RimI-like enzyme